MAKGGDGSRITAIVPAAGKGRRFGSEKKPFVRLDGKPLLAYVLNALQSSKSITDIVVVADGSLIQDVQRLVRRYNITKVATIAKGGRTRSESVKNGLHCIDETTSYVLIHDGVRPLLTDSLVDRTIRAAKRYGAAVAAVPVKATVKVVGRSNIVEYTPERTALREIQTPQVFRKGILIKAYKEKGAHTAFTDDASLVESIGVRVKIVNGDYRNIKVTVKEDIAIAEALLRKR